MYRDNDNLLPPPRLIGTLTAAAVTSTVPDPNPSLNVSGPYHPVSPPTVPCGLSHRHDLKSTIIIAEFHIFDYKSMKRKVKCEIEPRPFGLPYG